MKKRRPLERQLAAAKLQRFAQCSAPRRRLFASMLLQSRGVNCLPCDCGSAQQRRAASTLEQAWRGRYERSARRWRDECPLISLPVSLFVDSLNLSAAAGAPIADAPHHLDVLREASLSYSYAELRSRLGNQSQSEGMLRRIVKSHVGSTLRKFYPMEERMVINELGSFRSRTASWSSSTKAKMGSTSPRTRGNALRPLSAGDIGDLLDKPRSSVHAMLERDEGTGERVKSGPRRRTQQILKNERSGLKILHVPGSPAPVGIRLILEPGTSPVPFRWPAIAEDFPSTEMFDRICQALGWILPLLSISTTRAHRCTQESLTKATQLDRCAIKRAAAVLHSDIKLERQFAMFLEKEIGVTPKARDIEWALTARHACLPTNLDEWLNELEDAATYIYLHHPLKSALRLSGSRLSDLLEDLIRGLSEPDSASARNAAAAEKASAKAFRTVDEILDWEEVLGSPCRQWHHFLRFAGRLNLDRYSNAVLPDPRKYSMIEAALRLRLFTGKAPALPAAVSLWEGYDDMSQRWNRCIASTHCAMLDQKNALPRLRSIWQQHCSAP